MLPRPYMPWLPVDETDNTLTCGISAATLHSGMPLSELLLRSSWSKGQFNLNFPYYFSQFSD